MEAGEDWLEQLEEFLLDLDHGEETMLLEELDGFLTGVILCPALIMPSLWLPRIWSLNGAPEHESVFADFDEMKTIIGMIMLHYNNIAGHLYENELCYEPLLPVDAANDDILWELWAEGFDRAMAIAPDAWNPLLISNNDAAIAALAGLRSLIAIAKRESQLDQDVQERLTESAPGLIGPWVDALNDWRLSQPRPASSPLRAAPAPAKAGRNDPCPCGSGKKYKKCCGLN